METLRARIGEMPVIVRKQEAGIRNEKKLTKLKQQAGVWATNTGRSDLNWRSAELCLPAASKMPRRIPIPAR